MKQLLTLIAAVTLLTTCDKENDHAPTCPGSPADIRAKCKWHLVPTGQGSEYSYMVYFGDGREMFVAGVPGDTVRIEAIVDDLTSVEYRDTTGNVSYLNFHPLASDTASVRVDLLPCTRL